MTKHILTWLKNRIQKGSITDAATLDITDKKDASVEVSRVIVGVMQVDPDTGELIPFGTWAQPQVFQNTVEFQGMADFLIGLNIAGMPALRQVLAFNAIALGYSDYYPVVLPTFSAGAIAARIPTPVEGMVLGQRDLDEMMAYIDGAWRSIVTTGHAITGDIEVTGDVTVGDDVILGIGQRVEFEPGTYMYAQADNNLRFYAGGVWVLTITPTQFSMRQLIESTNNIRHAAIASPGATANWSKCYGHDVGGVNHFHAVDEAGKEFDLTMDNHGSFYGNHIAWTSVAFGGGGTFVIVSDTDIAASDCDDTTFQNDQELLIGTAGKYLITWSASVECALANKHLDMGIGINGTCNIAGRCCVESKFANTEEAIAGTTILDLAATNTVSLMVTNQDDNTQVEVCSINLSVVKVGET